MRNLHLIHKDAKAIKCEFYTVVLKNEAIIQKYPGGMSAFASKYLPRCNDELSVTCSMDSDDLKELFQTLWDNQFEIQQDFVKFDAADYAMWAFASKSKLDIPFKNNWLMGKCFDDGVYVWYRLRE